MVGVEFGDVTLDSARAGCAFHLETDAVFHQTQMFVSHNRRILAAFREQGIARGPARACSHMGVEMWIDAELCKRDAYFSGYQAALRYGARELAGARSRLNSDWPMLARLRLKGLFVHLAQRGRAVFDPSYRRFYERFHGALAHRRRLAPSPDELHRVARFLESDRDVARDVAELLEEMAPLTRRAAAVSVPCSLV